MNDTVEEDWPEWDDTFAERDARILFPNLYTGSNAIRNTGDRNDPIIGIPGIGGIPWSEGNKIIDDAFPDYTRPEPYDFEKAFAEWEQKTPRKAHFGGEYDGTVTEVDRLAGKRTNPVINEASFNAKSPDQVPPARKDSIASNRQSSGFPPTPGRYPSLSPSGRSQFDSSPDDEGPVTKKKKFNSKNNNANRNAKKMTGAGFVELTATSSVSEDYDEFGSYPPTPGAPSDMDVEKDGDITMDEAEPGQASAGTLPTPEGQDEISSMNPDVEMGEEVHVALDATLGAERRKRTDIHAVHDDPAEHVEHVAEDVVMGENSVGATENIEFDLAEHDKQTKRRDGEDAQSRHPLPPLFYATPRLASRISPVVEIPAPSVTLSAAPTVEVGTSGGKPTQNDLTDKNETSNKIRKSSQHTTGKNSATQHERYHVLAPTIPPGKQKQKQVSEASSPIVPASPLKLLQQSVKMGRKSSFSEAQASSEDTSKVKTKGKGRASGKAGIISQIDEDLIDDFVFMSEKEVAAMKSNDLRNHIRAIESLRRWHNGVNKQGMKDQYMKWQRGMQALKDSKAEPVTKAIAKAAEPSQVVGLGSEEEEGSDRDAEGSIDQEFFEAQESPVTGIVTPGPPLKSPFTDQPRSDGKSPFVAKLNAAKLTNESPARKAGRSPTPENEPEFYKKFEKEQEQEEMDKRRKSRSVSRPASYKV